jgi:hypothetical protein
MLFHKSKLCTAGIAMSLSLDGIITAYFWVGNVNAENPLPFFPLS